VAHSRTSARDPRIDLLRGFALLTLFIDHVPNNLLGALTMRNFGFADAAELFVILAGASSMAAYGKAFDHEGARSGVRRIFLRCLRIYLMQTALLFATLALVYLWRAHFGAEEADLWLFFQQPSRAIGHALVLYALPGSLNILPLYIVLLAAFPLFYAGLRYVPRTAIALSAGLWLAANLDGALNLPNWLDGQGWFFNPLAWQFLFMLGALGFVTLRANGGMLPRRRALVAVSWAYLAGSLVLAAPWTEFGLSDWRPFDLAPPDKTALAPVRLLDILAMTYLAFSSDWARRVANLAWAKPFVTCGRHSLEVFALATLIALVFRSLFHDFGPAWELQVLVNVVGPGLMLALAVVLEHGRQHGRAHAPEHGRVQNQLKAVA
jgi:hypothetical protein